MNITWHALGLRPGRRYRLIVDGHDTGVVICTSGMGYLLRYYITVPWTERIVLYFEGRELKFLADAKLLAVRLWLEHNEGKL